jgi:anaerobic magnesium-protoporphyrin IX monomethyl ester cyclase
MANILFISLYDRNAYGQRLMSANLKKHGHHCHIIFLKRFENQSTYNLDYDEDEYPWLGIDMRGHIIRFAANSLPTESELELLRELILKINPDVIGMTVNTPLRKHATMVTQFIKQHFNLPIIWGGFDPTVQTAKCLENSDYVCIGEGDQTIIEIAERIDQNCTINDVCNLAYLKDNKIIYNSKALLENNIDSYPWRDNSPENKYFIEDNELTENYGEVNDGDPGFYETMSSRGCPYRCSYCCEDLLKNLYIGEKFLRRRSPQDLIAELIQAKQQLKLKEIHFEDEIFGINLKWLLQFIPLYKVHINLPFHAYIYPSNNIEEILKTLKDAGLKVCSLSLQSGSERINKIIFNRVYNRELYLKTARICKELNILFYTDIITFNPYEQEEDLKKTLDVLMEIGGNFNMSVNKLFILPGTKLAEKIQNDGLDIKDTSRDKLFNYYSRLYWITTSAHFSRFIVQLIEYIHLFKKYPFMINPLIIKAILSPSVVYRKFRKLIFHN